jgi:hypothetical protein
MIRETNPSSNALVGFNLFEQKAADIIGLYMNQPQHAAVFCVVRRRPFRLWTGSISCCRCHRDERHGAGNIKAPFRATES